MFFKLTVANVEGVIFKIQKQDVFTRELDLLLRDDEGKEHLLTFVSFGSDDVYYGDDLIGKRVKIEEGKIIKIEESTNGKVKKLIGGIPVK